MGNSATSESLKPAPTIKSMLSLGDKSSNSVSTIVRKHLDLMNHLSSGPKTPIPTEYKLQFADTNNMKKKHHLNKKECVKKNNGITGICLSHKIAQNLYIFWRSHMDTLPPKKQLEISVLIYFTMLKYCDGDFKLMFKNKTIEHKSLLFVGKLRWLIMALNDDSIDLHALLSKLGNLHQTKTVKLQYFEAFLSALHKVFSEYFPNKYKIEIKYCLDKTFVICTKIMLGKSPIYTRLSDWSASRSIKTSEIWLKNLDTCLKSRIGKEYFFRFLEQTACYELVIFFTLYWQFNRAMSEKEKFMVSRKIVNTCIDVDDTSPFPINISYETKMNFMHKMKGFEEMWRRQLRKSVLLTDTNKCRELSPFTIPNDLLDEMLFEIKRLIRQNHWRLFCLQIESMCNTASASLETSETI